MARAAKRLFPTLLLAAQALCCAAGSLVPLPAEANHKNSKGSATTDTVRIVMTGDILLDRYVRRTIERHGIDTLFSPSVDSLLAASDCAVGNLECPATRIHAPASKRFIFRAEPEWLEALRRHGFTHLNLANNHSIDQGRRGLMDTRRNVVLHGMVPVGADSTMAEAARPVLLCDSPRPVYLLASLRLSLENMMYLPDRPSVSQEPMDSLVARVARLRSEQPGAVIIASLHWGAEHTLQPVASQRKEARRLIDAGADCLVCHHSHTFQTVENYRGRKIFYSIGNFIFDQRRDINTRACVVELKVWRDGLSVEALPIRIHNHVPVLTPL